MVLLLDISAISHPNIAKTRKNAEAPFLRLPIELRLRIYEYALTENGPIYVLPIAERSNEFYGVRNIEKPQRSARSTILIHNLSQVSRHFFIDLEVNPIFYRVNRFYFNRSEYLLKFLAAITPVRYASIRDIELQVNHRDIIQLLRAAKIEYPSFGIPGITDHAAALLSRCASLRHLVMRFPSGFNFVNLLRMYVCYARSGHIDRNLVTMSFVEPVFGSGSTKINLANRDCLPQIVIDHYKLDEIEISLVMQAKAAVSLLKHRWEEAERAGLRTFTNKQVSEAIAFAGIDVPGDKRMNRAYDSGSSRARQSFRKASVIENRLI